MSRDVAIMRFPEGFDGDFDEIPDSWEPEKLFTQDYFVDKTWMTLNAEAFSIEFNIGDTE